MRKFYIVMAVLFLVVGFACFYYRGVYEEYGSVLSIVGSVASIFGIIIAIVQAYQTKTVAEAAKEASIESAEQVREGINTVKQVFILSDITEILHLPNEIQDSIQNKKWERAYEKMRNLKDALVEFQAVPEIQSQLDVQIELASKINELDIRLISFGKGISDNRNPYAYNRTSELMEELRTFLRNLSTRTKFNHISR